MMNKNNWVFQQVELIESNVCLENPGRGWYGIYTFVVQDSINPEELRWSLRDGELLALGTHKELIDTCEYYRNLYETQKKLEQYTKEVAS